ncbi:hypothetical protein TNCV_2199251 [Trichonephila clavipes]|nr:hypothetical protein TNCV_2199251 [Trichonephila clavipes]
MVVLCLLETSLYLFFSIITDYIQFNLVSFFEILGCVLVIDLIRNLIGSYFESITQVSLSLSLQESTEIVKRDEGKSVRTGVPEVYSLMIYKICQGLDLEVKLAAVQDKKMWIAKSKSQDKERRPVPKVYSKTILMFCKALDIDAELSHSTEEHPPEKQLKRAIPLPIVHSIMIFKMCQGLGLSAKLGA